jgi:hypothetical protein
MTTYPQGMKPFALSLSKGRPPLWFEKLTTNGMSHERRCFTLKQKRRPHSRTAGKAGCTRKAMRSRKRLRFCQPDQ